MKSIQLLKNKALDPAVSISELLRIAYTIAVELNLVDFKKWLHSEMYGYENIHDLPSYRLVHGVMVSLNPAYGCWQTVKIYDKKILEFLHSTPTTNKISEIEHLLNFSEKSSFIHQELPIAIQKIFAENNFGMKSAIYIGKQNLAGILDTVRNEILDWALELEKKGILGDEEMNFSDKERMQAQGITINNYIVGNNTNAPIQQGNNNVMQLKPQNDDIETIKVLITEIKNVIEKFDVTQQQELQSEIASIEPQLQSPNPKIKIINIALQSIRNIFEGAIGSYLSSVPSVIDTFNKVKNFISS